MEQTEKNKNNTENDKETETAYKRLLRKVNENKRKAEMGKVDAAVVTAKKPRTGKTKNVAAANLQIEKHSFVEDDNFVEMEVSKDLEREEFPTPSEDEGSDESDP